MIGTSRSWSRRAIAAVSAALVVVAGGGFGTLTAPPATADTTDTFIGGPDQLYVGYADSEETQEPNGNGPAAKAIDGVATTYWHTNWSVGNTETPGPHWISVGTFPGAQIADCSFTGIEYTQRQGSSGTGKHNGIVGNYEIHVSDSPIEDGVGFTDTTRVASGTFENTDSAQVVRFEGPATGKFVTLKALSALVNSQNLTSVGDIRLIGSCHTEAGATIVTPTAPIQSENGASITVPTIAGVDYKINGAIVTGDVTLNNGATTVTATPRDGYTFFGDQSVSYDFSYEGMPIPATIPSLTGQFARSEGTWTATQDVTVVRPDTFASSAQLLVDELNAYTNGDSVTGATNGTGVEIVIDDTHKESLGEEGYTLSIQPAGVTITAATARGAFWGTRTLSQMLRQSLTLPAGSVTDTPTYKERGVTLCACQINFSTEWIERFLNEMADLKLNSILMEMKLKSDAYPAANTFSYYSREDVKAFVEKADSYGIDVIPEINSPGHMNIWLENLPQFQLKDQAGNGSVDRLDITNPQAVEFYKTLIDEYDGVFSTNYWHMGADEYLMGASYATYPQLARYAREVTGNSQATGADAFTYFINDINSYVKAKGKTLRIWNDGIVATHAVTLDKDIVVEHWLGSGRSANELANDGYRLVNANLKLYFARATPYPIQARGPAFLYNDPNFDVNIFQGRDGVVSKTDNILGAKLSIWPDNGVKQTENEVELDVYEAMRYIAQITWSGGNPSDNPTYADFKAKRVDKIERSPMWENINRKPLEDGVYTISQPAGKSLQLAGNASLGDGDEWTLTSTPDHYYQLKNMATNQCLSVVSGYKHLSTVTQVGARPEARPCVDVSKIYTGNQAGNSGYAERNPQKWMLLTTGDDSFEIVNAVTLQRLAVATGAEEHIDFVEFNGTKKDTKPAAGEIVQLPGDMTDDVWKIEPSTRTFTATVAANPLTAYPSADDAGAATMTVTITNRTDANLTNVVVKPPVKNGWLITPGAQTIDTIGAGEAKDVTFKVKPDWYRGEAEFVFNVTAGEQSANVRATISAVCGLPTSPTAVGASSEELTGERAPNGPKEAAVDGNPATFWHTAWQNSHPDYPHYIDLQVGEDGVDLCGFVYTPRQGQVNGRVKDYEIYAANEMPSDPAGWGEPVARGSFEDSTKSQLVSLDGVKAKYLRFQGLNAQPSATDATVMSAGELQVIRGTGAPKTLVEPAEPTYDGLSYTIPATEGVTYLVDGAPVTPGSHEGQAGSTLVVTAEPADGYYFSDSFYDNDGKFIPWVHTFETLIVPDEPTWDDENLTITVPESEYVDYLLGSTLLSPGTHSVEPGYVAQMSAQLKDGLADGITLDPQAQTTWTHQFPDKAVVPDEPAEPVCETIDRPSTPAKATDRLGEASGDRFADLWAIDADGHLRFYPSLGNGKFAGKGVVSCDAQNFASMAPIPDMNGDGRADMLVTLDDGRAFFYNSQGDGFLTRGQQAGHGWSNLDNLTYVGKIGSSRSEFVVARHVPSGDLYRYVLTPSGMHSGTKIGHSWGGMRSIMSAGDLTGDGVSDVIATGRDGGLYLYAGSSDGYISLADRIGHGWDAFTHVTVPGDTDGDGRLDLVGIRNDGKLFSYHNTGSGWGPAKEAGHGWSSIALIG